jgi:hypothetical protein
MSQPNPKPGPPGSELPPLFSLTAVAKILGMQECSVRYRAISHNIRHVTEGDGYRVFTATDVDYLRNFKKRAGKHKASESPAATEDELAECRDTIRQLLP